MRIIIDARMFETGIGRYCEKLLTELEKLDLQNEYLVLMPRRLWDNYRPRAKNFKKVEVNIAPYSLANQTAMPALLRKLKPDLVHFTHFTVPMSYAGPYVVTVHDMTLLDFNTARGGVPKKLAYKIKQAAMQQVLSYALVGAKIIITSTQFTADDIRKRFKPKAPIEVIHLAADRVTGANFEPPKVKPPFIMYVGNFYPHKNIPRLIEAFKEVVPNQPELKLVLAGQTEYFDEQLKKQARRLGISEKVRFVGRVADRELAGFYKAADALVFPSLSEGFGLPPLEAMAHGTPVLSSNASCMPEILGDAAIYFDPKDIHEMADEIDALLNSPEEAARLKKLGPKQASKYSWAKMAKQTLDIYKSI